MATTTSLGAKLWGVVSSGVSAVSASKDILWKTNGGTRRVFLEPGDVLVDFAVLAFRDIGTKVHFDEDGRMHNDTPYGYALQGAKRYLTGSSSDQLYSCSTALYHAIHLLKPESDAERLTPLFECAIEGARNLVKTYEAEEDFFTAQNIHNSHLKMLLQKDVEGFSPAEFFVPDLRDNPLLQKSLELWSGDDYDKLKQVADAFDRANKSRASSEAVEANIATARVTLNQVFDEFKSYRAELLGGETTMRLSEGSSRENSVEREHKGESSGGGGGSGELSTKMDQLSVEAAANSGEGGKGKKKGKK